jgi:hypothetical protein
VPPDHSVQARSREPFPIDDTVLVIGPPPELEPMTPVAVHPARGERPGRAVAHRPGDTTRIVFASLLFLSVTLLMFSALDRSQVGMTIFGLLALGALLGLAMPRRAE